MAYCAFFSLDSSSRTVRTSNSSILAESSSERAPSSANATAGSKRRPIRPAGAQRRGTLRSLCYKRLFLLCEHFFPLLGRQASSLNSIVEKFFWIQELSEFDTKFVDEKPKRRFHSLAKLNDGVPVIQKCCARFSDIDRLRNNE